MTKYNNGIGYHNGVEMSGLEDTAIFVRKVNPLLALGRWQAFYQGLSTYGETRAEAVANAKSESGFCFEEDI